MSIETPIFEEASYDITYDVREHSNSTNVNVLCLSEEDMPLVEQGKESKDAIQKKDDVTLPDHTGIPMEEIPYFYSNYAKKVGFVTRIRNTNFDKTRKKLKVPINQSIHCSREGYRESRVKAAMRVKRITTAECKARMYVILDRQNDNWLVTKLELKHTHTCSAEQAVHYNIYDNRRMWVPIYFQGEFWAGMKSTQRSESMHAFYGSYLHCKSALVQFVHEYDNVLGNKEQKELEDDAADSKGFREVQHEFSKRGDCLVQGVTQEGDLFRVTVNEQYLLYGEPRSWKYSVEFDPKTHKTQYHLVMLSLDGARMYIKSTLSSRAAMTRSDRMKAITYLDDCVHTSTMLPKILCVPSTQNSTVTQCHPHLGESDIQGPSKVSTKGRPRMKRLGSELDTSIKRSMRRKKKNSPLLCEVDQALNQDVVMDFARRANESQEHGGFLSLLNSFWPA
ncbi:Protein FAR-RED ELONGATED HYPOCOTYL [Arachis hypogaea]|nr:Protein FAR-RED ELONGATED HYPOCOTYL [Arachis hypogaea]